VIAGGRRFRRVLGGLALLATLPGFAACASVVLTPHAMRAADVPIEDRERAVSNYAAAVARCNEFLASPFRHALPAGQYVLDDGQGLFFETAGGTWPIEVRCTGWGDVVQWFGFKAQEGEGGFTVAACPPDRDRAVDNGLLREKHGYEVEPDLVADLILHETTHVVSDEGAIGFWKSASYYLECVFLWRFDRSHSDERRAYSTAEEYHQFIQSVGRGEAETARLLAELEAHIAASTDDACHHVPAPAASSPPLPAPAP